MSFKKVIHISIMLSLFLSANGWYAQSLRITLSNNQIKIGEQTKLNIELNCNTSQNVLWHNLKDTLNKYVEIVHTSKIDTTYAGQDLTQKILSQTLTITSFDSGYHVIKPIEVNVEDQPIISEAEVLYVSTVQIDEEKGIAGIKSPYEVKLSLLDYIKLYKKHILISLGTLILLAAIVFWLLKRKSKTTEIMEPLTPPQPIDIIAIEKLESLNAKKLWQAGKYKEYHSELSEIIREYIEKRFHLNALESTSEEIMQNLRTTLPSAELKDKLRQLLLLSDLAKFAKERPIASENELSLKNAFDFVYETRVSKEETEVEKPRAQETSV